MTNIRNGQIVWPYCEECGCRLLVSPTYRLNSYLLCHFGILGKDAKGHECEQFEKTWYRSLQFVRAAL